MTDRTIYETVSLRVVKELANHQRHNFCSERYPERPPFWTRFRNWWFELLQPALQKLGVVVNPRQTYEIAEANLRAVAEASHELEATRALLADQASRQTLEDVLTYRVLGFRHVKLALNTSRYWNELKKIDALEAGDSDLTVPSSAVKLRRYNLQSLGVPISFLNLPLGVHTIYLIEQYAYRNGPIVIEAKDGDVVIDGGGCWAETALYFANKVGARGHVVSLEFESANLRLFDENLNLNPALKGRIVVEKKALWHTPGLQLRITAQGPGTKVSEGGGTSVPTTTIDDLIIRGVVERVDFVKLDIEGADFDALRGAEQTLRRFRPKLAVAVYHSLEDFVRIPKFLSALGVGYRFYLKHCTIYSEETVLFATVD